MSTPHIGDTEQISSINDGATPKCQRQWSSARTMALVALIASALLYVLAVAGQPGKRVVELPNSGVVVLRIVLGVAFVSFIAAWSYDRIAPRLWQRFAAQRVGARALEARMTDLAAVGDRVERWLAGQAERDRRIDLRVGNLDERVGRMEESLRRLADAIATYGVDKRQEGFEAAFGSDVDPDTDAHPLPKAAGRFPAVPGQVNGHLRSV